MQSQEPLSRSGIMARADLPKDLWTFWIKRGVLLPLNERLGGGNHLRFAWYEANIAGLVNQLRVNVGVPIEGLVSIASTFRDAVAWAERRALTRDDVYALWTVFNLRALRDRGDYGHNEEEFQAALEVWRQPHHGAQRVTERIEGLADQIGKPEFRQHLDAFLVITEQPEPGQARARHQPHVSYFWRTGDRWRFMQGDGGPEEARKDGALVTIAVDVATVIYDVWNRP